MFYQNVIPKNYKVGHWLSGKNLGPSPRFRSQEMKGFLDPAPLMAAFHSHQLVTAREKVSRMEGLTWKI